MRAPVLSLSVQYASHRQAPDRAQCRRWVEAAQLFLPPTSLFLTVRFVDEAEGRELNRTFRGRDYPTNVLTFSYPEKGQVHADLVLCVPVIEREVRQQKKDPKAHFAHMVIHGVLHAHGLDHEKSAQAEAMEALEKQILARFRIQDPYA